MRAYFGREKYLRAIFNERAKPKFQRPRKIKNRRERADSHIFQRTPMQIEISKVVLKPQFIVIFGEFSQKMYQTRVSSY